MVETMTWQGNALAILDQTQLPQKTEIIICKDYRRVRVAIKKLEVRGAPAIGASAAFAMVLGAQEVEDHPDFMGALARIRDDINTARPTAVNLFWGTKQIYDLADRLHEEGLAPVKILPQLEALAKNIYEQDIETCHRMGAYGAEAVPDEAVILTHCNAGSLATCGWGTALGVIRSAHELGKVKMVYADETRPLLQGARLTTYELCEDNIPVTLITDNMAAWTMKKKGINFIVVGADRIAANGDTANKIGTYGVALAAKAHNIPFYIVAPVSTFDFSIATGAEIPIEERKGEEVKSFRSETTAHAKALTYNPAFDVTPHELITGIITEHGILRAPYEESIRRLQEQTLGL